MAGLGSTRTVENPQRARLYELELRKPSLAPTSTTRGAKPGSRAALDRADSSPSLFPWDDRSACWYRRYTHVASPLWLTSTPTDIASSSTT